MGVPKAKQSSFSTEPLVVTARAAARLPSGHRHAKHSLDRFRVPRPFPLLLTEADDSGRLA